VVVRADVNVRRFAGVAVLVGVEEEPIRAEAMDDWHGPAWIEAGSGHHRHGRFTGPYRRSARTIPDASRRTAQKGRSDDVTEAGAGRSARDPVTA